MRFQQDLQASALFQSPADSLDELLLQYETCIADVINIHAPLKTKTISSQAPVPWFTEEIADAKRDRRKAEQKWRDSGLTIHRELYMSSRNKVNILITTSKKKYYNQQVQSCKDQKSIFKILNRLLFRNEQPKLPTTFTGEDLTEQFNEFFTTKIKKIREKLDSTQSVAHSLPHQPPVTCDTPLTNFTPLSDEDILKLIKSMPCKSCELDPLPTRILLDHIDVLLPSIAKIINMSLATSHFPKSMKQALVRPLLKKPSLDQDALRNYRPVSNLSFISKLTEKAADKQFSAHFSNNNLLPTVQSAYRPLHSVETALTKVHNDIMCAVDESKAVILVLLDLSAAFDTIDHGLLLQRLNEMGVRGNALEWERSYLSDRTQAIRINGHTSTRTLLQYGVPQGSVKGPKDFIAYTSPIQAIAEMYTVSVYLYADDTQLYIPFCPKSETETREAVSRMEACIAHISSWMRENKLQLNQEKTELVIISSKNAYQDINISSINIGNITVKASANAKNLGVFFDQHMNMHRQVSNICSLTNFQLRQIGKIRKFLTRKATESLIHAIITSRIDNNNALLSGLPDYQTDRLQRLQNCAARIVALTKYDEHITPVLKDLHWLPVSSRIKFKLSLLVYKCLHNEAPSYLCDLISPYEPPRQLRSSDKGLLNVPRSRKTRYGDRAFSKSAPILWNNLPNNIRDASSTSMFKSSLKTYLFNLPA
ncbi:MAG: reverse transcriptase family protein [Flavobacteriaceae bacterium]|nr:reverse transcriptase family protein [Flavobacteriaceae bacterium]